PQSTTRSSRAFANEPEGQSPDSTRSSRPSAVLAVPHWPPATLRISRARESTSSIPGLLRRAEPAPKPAVPATPNDVTRVPVSAGPRPGDLVPATASTSLSGRAALRITRAGSRCFGPVLSGVSRPRPHPLEPRGAVAVERLDSSMYDHGM